MSSEFLLLSTRAFSLFTTGNPHFLTDSLGAEHQAEENISGDVPVINVREHLTSIRLPDYSEYERTETGSEN
jgi:hypothetical protein